ncbi:hypothetical protein CA599_26260, partial [Paenibacillus taichungensis]
SPEERSVRQLPHVVRPGGVPGGDSRKRADSNIHTFANAAAVPPKTTHPGCPEGGAPMGSPLVRGI